MAKQLTWTEKEVKRKLGMNAYSCPPCRDNSHWACYGICDCYKLHIGTGKRSGH